jgi:hypothetical protein
VQASTTHKMGSRGDLGQNFPYMFAVFKVNLSLKSYTDQKLKTDLLGFVITRNTFPNHTTQKRHNHPDIFCKEVQEMK